MPRKKIFFVMPQLGGGGGERVISILLNNIGRDSFEPHLIIVKKKGNNSFVQDLSDDVVLHHLNIIAPIRKSFLKIVFTVVKVLKEEKADVVFLGSGQLNALFALFLNFLPKSCKKIARESNIPSKFEKFKLLKIVYRFFYKNYDKIIVQSDDMYNDLHLNFKIPKNKLVKINNPIDVGYINFKLKESDEIILPKARYNIVAAGRLTHQKGFDLLLNELAVLSQDINYHLTILGTGEDKEALENQLMDLQLKGRVSFEGNVANPYLYMAKGDLFILSSRFEGFPNVVLEALMCGTPVLANNCLGGISEIIRPGFNGLIFSYEKSNFEDMLKNALKMKFKEKEIIEDAIDRFSVAEKIRQFENCILN